MEGTYQCRRRWTPAHDRRRPSPVHVVGDVSSIADSGDQILERVPRRLLVFVQVNRQQVFGNLSGLPTPTFILLRQLNRVRLPPTRFKTELILLLSIFEENLKRGGTGRPSYLTVMPGRL